MKITTTFAIAATALSAVVAVAPASAQHHGRAPMHRMHRGHHHKVCTTRYAHHHRIRVCR